MAAALPILTQDIGPVSRLPPLWPLRPFCSKKLHLPILMPEHPRLDLHEAGSSQHFMSLPQTGFCDLAVTGLHFSSQFSSTCHYLKVNYLLTLLISDG